MTISELQVLILKCLNKHCEATIPDLKLVLLGDKKVEDLTSWCELRISGPDFKFGNDGSYKVNVSLNILVSTERSGLDIYDHYDNVGKATKAFEERVVLDDYGCLTQVGTLDTRHYGDATEKISMSRTTINCNYTMEV